MTEPPGCDDFELGHGWVHGHCRQRVIQSTQLVAFLSSCSSGFAVKAITYRQRFCLTLGTVSQRNTVCQISSSSFSVRW